MSGQRLRVAEIFSSLQGEGILAGTSSVFVRLSGCNLRCVWCDTPYASWNPEGDFHTVENVVENVLARPIEHVVITGGEPMIFEPVVALCEALASARRHITIETAGTVFRKLSCNLMSISPKLSNSTPGEESGWRKRHEKTRVNMDALSELIEEYSHQVKFVIGSDAVGDIAEAEALLARLPEVKPERVLLMPEGTDAQCLSRNLRILAPFALERGWRLSPRLHIDLFGNTRGT